MNRKQRRQQEAEAKRRGAKPPPAGSPREQELLNQAVAHHQAGRLEDAQAIYDELLRANPRDPDALHYAGVLALQTDRPEEARDLINRAIDICPQGAEAHTSLAVTLMTLGDVQEAGRNFALALERNPQAAFTNANLGRFHADHDDPDAAEPLLRRALEIDPDFHEALTDLGALMNATYRAGDALPLLEKARSLRPDSVKARSEYATALELSGNPGQALDEFLAIVRDDPGDDKGHNNVGLILSRLNRFDDAILAYGEALKVNPDYEQVYSNRSLLRLAQGDFAGGWKDYLHRDTLGEMADKIQRDVLPDDLSGKRIALYRDQGLGDEIFFLRFVRQLKDRGATVDYNPDLKIAGMIGRLYFIDNFVGGNWPTERYDLKISLGDLPFLLSVTELSEIPAPLQIPVLPDRDAEITEFLESVGPPPYIGCTWRAGVQYRDRLSKMSPQKAMAEALRPINGSILILQRNPRDDEIADLANILGNRLHDASGYNEDLEGMLALLGRIDEYVCVSNTNTHLRAARGLTSRVLIPLPPDYRWMQSGEDSPWFPGTPLYRETADTGWDGAFEKLGRDLIEAVGSR